MCCARSTLSVEDGSRPASRLELDPSRRIPRENRSDSPSRGRTTLHVRAARATQMEQRTNTLYALRGARQCEGKGEKKT